MAIKIPITFFAPAEREPIEVVHRQARRLNQTPLARTFRQASANYLVVVNARRQIVMASENVLDLIPEKTVGQLLGLRLGEALSCVHACECESGCGTSQSCRECGVVRVMLSGLDGRRDTQECRLTRRILDREVSLELFVVATPLLEDNERFTLLTVTRTGNGA
jgi:hypothetical protein